MMLTVHFVILEDDVCIKGSIKKKQQTQHSVFENMYSAYNRALTETIELSIHSTHIIINIFNIHSTNSYI
jgi:hypothetical protein